MRAWIVWTGVVALGWGFAPVASAQGCMQCENSGGFFNCAMTQAGGRVCRTTGIACAVALPCPGFPNGRDRDGVLGMRPLTLYAVAYGADPARRSPGGRVLRGMARDFTLARIGAVVEREVPGARADRPLEAAMTVATGAIAVAQASPGGEGCAMRVIPAAPGYRVVVRTLEMGRMGRVLISDLVGEGDLLLVPVTIGAEPMVIAVRVTSHDGGPQALGDAQRRFFDEARALGATRDLGLQLEAREPSDF